MFGVGAGRGNMPRYDKYLAFSEDRSVRDLENYLEIEAYPIEIIRTCLSPFLVVTITESHPQT